MDYIKEKIDSFNTKHSDGFISSEIDTLLESFPNINMDKFNNGLTGITGTVSDNGDMVVYRHDVHRALVIGIENKPPHWGEWD